MRICHFTSSSADYPYFAVTCRELATRGHDVVIATLGDHDAPAWIGEAEGVEYFALSARRRYSYACCAAALARELRKRRIDVLNAHLFEGGMVGLAGGILARVPLRVLVRHHLDEHQVRGKPVHTRIDKWLARRADCTFVPSHAVKGHMLAVERLQGAEIHVVHIGFDFERLDRLAATRARLRKELGLETSFVIGYTGRMVPEKGLMYLFDAFQAVRELYADARLLLVGDGPGSWLEDAVKARGLSDHVIRLGFRGDAPACIAAMDVAVHPSLTDAFPQVVIEAMAVGTPIVATRVGGIPEIVSHGSTGWLVEARDSEALGAAIAEVRGSGMGDCVARRARESVRARFGFEQMVSEQLAHYARYMGADRKAGRLDGARTRVGRVELERGTAWSGR
jgi:glycosyltransferase involved in cell wall biosynthesis